MSKRNSLSDYVKSVNGVPLGHSKSLRNMLNNSLGANSFSSFWRYWNPIWSYYLRYFVYRPLRNFFPEKVAIIATFLVSGGIHDVAVLLITGQGSFIITIWFGIMAFVVVLEDFAKISLKKFIFPFKALIHVMTISTCYVLARLLLTL
ncbi:MBOAT family O-acyltransferase [Maribacter chungangensis]|uniref:MBOAT family O-acyltransferase n=1 Tax=Maribacter chungangensis TaxID=1069117 RepID=A0ABW3AZT7_9FLAO